MSHSNLISHKTVIGLCQDILIIPKAPKTSISFSSSNRSHNPSVTSCLDVLLRGLNIRLASHAAYRLQHIRACARLPAVTFCGELIWAAMWHDPCSMRCKVCTDSHSAAPEKQCVIQGKHLILCKADSIFAACLHTDRTIAAHEWQTQKEHT